MCRIYKPLFFSVVESVEGVEAVFTPQENLKTAPKHTCTKKGNRFTAAAFTLSNKSIIMKNELFTLIGIFQFLSLYLYFKIDVIRFADHAVVKT